LFLIKSTTAQYGKEINMLNTTFNRCNLRVLAASALAITLAACGGGGSGDGTQSNAPGLQAAVSDSSTGASTGGAQDISNNNSGDTNSGSGAGSSAPSAEPATPAATSGPYGQDAGAYTLAFSDEFDNGVNGNVWNDHMWYDSSNGTKNYAVEDGALKIWPQRDGSGNFFNRTLDTDGKYYQKYGYFEIEAKLPVGKGTWPAFWLFNHIGDRRPEIDVMEAYSGGNAPWGATIDGQPHPTAYGTTIWSTGGVQAAFRQNATPDLSAAFHKYGVKWEPNKVTFYFDGTAVYSTNTSMSDPMYIMLDLWFGSASGTPDGTTPTGKGNAYVVNYVRAWQFK
jgi:beta-glucanase (GH16 family)